MDKKGVERQVLITTILVIVSFIIILMVIGRFAAVIPDTFDREACRSSVLIKAGLEAKPILSKALGLSPALKCKTEYLCLNKGGKCPKQGYEKVTVKTDDEIKRKVAESMYNCWYQLGEGKADFLGDNFLGLGTQESTCVICSVIKFDEFTNDKQLDFSNYLEKTKIPVGNKTYLEYFTDMKEAKLPTQLKAEELNTNKDYAIVFAGLKGGKDLQESLNDMTGTVGTAITAGIGLKTVGVSLLSAKGALLIAIPAAVFKSTQLGFNSWNAHIATIRCDKESKGCFTMMLLPNTAEEISQVCERIESIP
ncbi:hypothetical protein ACFLZZ_02115 [Nanoarchaeota archaeon]